jgi:hypothetical protein
MDALFLYKCGITNNDMNPKIVKVKLVDLSCNVLIDQNIILRISVPQNIRIRCQINFCLESFSWCYYYDMAWLEEGAVQSLRFLF